MRNMKSIISYTLLALLGLTMMGNLMACNTMHGAGKDIERGGEHLQDAAEDAKH